VHGLQHGSDMSLPFPTPGLHLAALCEQPATGDRNAPTGSPGEIAKLRPHFRAWLPGSLSRNQGVARAAGQQYAIR
jgi:hypothetical protein